MTTIRDLASIARSKNAGPFTITIDLFFEDGADYERVRDSGAITPSTVADLYDVPEDDVVGIYTLDRINAVKISIRRSAPAGDVRDTDVYGAQQHSPLFDVEIP